MKNIADWVQEPLQQLKADEKIFILNENVGYNREKFLIDLLNELIRRAREEEQTVTSSKLKIYCQIIRKILSSITIYRFNSYFYSLLREFIVFVVERPMSMTADEDNADAYVIAQLCDSEYPE